MRIGIRKTFILLLALLMLIPTILTANAAAATITLSTAQGAVGDEVAVKVSILNNPGITALSIQVSYSADDLELIGVDGAGLFEDQISTSQLTKNPVTISWYASDSANKNDSGEFAVLRFKIREGAKNSAITVSYDEDNIFNNAFDDVYFGTVDGQVTVKPKAVIGDADGDGNVTLMDATAVQRFNANLYTGIYTVVLMNGDVDANGLLEIVDATYIMRHVTGIGIPYAIG